MDVLKTICKLFGEDTVCLGERLNDTVLKMLHNLVKHLILIEPLSINMGIEEDRYHRSWSISFHMKVNNNIIASNDVCLKKLYLTSLLLILLESDICCPDAITPRFQALVPVVAAKHIPHALAIDDLWNA